MRIAILRFLILIFLIEASVAQPVLATIPTEHWQALTDGAQAVTGDVVFAPGHFVFGNGKSLAVDKPIALRNFLGLGQMITATLYRVTTPTALTLLNGAPLCGTVAKSLPVTFLIIWAPQPLTAGERLRELAVYDQTSLPKSDRDAGSCGTFGYDAISRE